MRKIFVEIMGNFKNKPCACYSGFLTIYIFLPGSYVFGLLPLCCKESGFLVLGPRYWVAFTPGFQQTD